MARHPYGRNYRAPFDRDRDFTVVRSLPASGRSFGPGDLFDKTLVSTRRLRLLYEQRFIKFAEPTRNVSEAQGRVQRIRLQRRRAATVRGERASVPA